MKETTSTTITKSSQVTLPARAQRALGVKPGDRLELTIEGNQVRLSVPRYPTVASLVGAAGTLEKPLSIRQMREIAYQDRFAEDGD